MNKTIHLFRRFALIIGLIVQSTLLRASTLIDGLYYDLDTSSRTASVTYETTGTDNYASLSANVKIPETVMYNGVTFTVKKIADGAFANCTSLEEISIPGTVVEVGTTFDAHYRSGYGESKYVYDSLPFYNCTALKKVKFEDGTLPIQLGVAWVDDRYYPSDTKGLFYYSPLEEVYIGRNITYKDKSGH